MIAALAPEVNFHKCVSDNENEHAASLKNHEFIWLEWGNELAVALTNNYPDLLRGKRVIVRIHRYEMYNGLAEKINYEVVDDVILVGRYMRDVFLRKCAPKLPASCRVHAVPNGVDIRRFQARPEARRNGRRLASASFIQSIKNPMLMLHAFACLPESYPSYELHIAGKTQEYILALGMNEFVRANRMHNRIFMYKWQDDMAAWLQDKDFYLSASVSESQGMSIMEAAACGLKPLVCNFPGASSIYPGEFIWRNINELIRMAQAPREPERYRSFVENNYSLDLQASNLKRLILDRHIIGPRDIIY
ncbi:MAG: glycosyltransferase family 4 protein [Desulfarculales bacterium]|jgi:glycosyltransferase involved in cell wall biosynthesis|nr:glycosyltransferase family 4 protein [Desulfarculales bacterium]